MNFNSEIAEKTLVVIPARFESTRLPGKVLADIGGKPLIHHVLERVCLSGLKHIAVATDSKEVALVCEAFGAKYILTDPKHPNGTSRCIEAFEKLHQSNSFEVLLNVQGDEPFIDPKLVYSIPEFLLENDEANIATAFHVSQDLKTLEKNSVVKLVTDMHSRVLYFSRSLIPYKIETLGIDIEYKIHIGIYGFRSRVLDQIKNLTLSPLEKSESLEQLRWLYHGIPVYAIAARVGSLSVDTPTDLELARQLYLHGQNK